MADIRLTFHGGAGSVTGANFLLEVGERKFLVDCGLKQGCKFCDEENREPFPYDPKSIESVFITHSHIDHIGRVPLLAAGGFRGSLYSTPETKELSYVMLEDSMGVLSKEARADSLPPLYTEQDIDRAMRTWKTVPYHDPIPLAPGVEARFLDAGHILGSAMVEIRAGGKTIVFTGDLGNSPAPLLNDTERVPAADYLVMESVYGDRVHEKREERKAQLRSIILETVQGEGTLLIPAFSLERTQILLYEINAMVESGAIPPLPVFLDSPLAIAVTEIYRRRAKLLKWEVQREIEGGDDIFNFPGLVFTRSTAESKMINETRPPKIIIAGAGMSNGGRIQHHEKRYLSDPHSTLLFVGYQVSGSLGRLILDGVKEVSIHGETVPVRARIERLSGYSAHRDQNGLVEFVRPLAGKVKKVFIAMGEQEARDALGGRLKSELGVVCVAPEKGDSVEL